VDRALKILAILRTNILGRTASGCREKNSLPRFLHIQHGEVSEARRRTEFTEEAHLDPRSPTLSKAAADHLVSALRTPMGFRGHPALYQQYALTSFPKADPLMMPTPEKQITSIYGDGLAGARTGFSWRTIASPSLWLSRRQAGAIYKFPPTRPSQPENCSNILNFSTNRNPWWTYVQDRPGHDGATLSTALTP